ncbi:MAG: nitroreductase [Candidatus Izemoplasmatales bacterium]|jgi:nitroreductase|nr:nitroreductase [Candidatus Izemoplasmatales bacterium]
MNSTIENILSRRSIRSYEEKPIPEDILQKIIECAIYAPSSRNKQEWHLTVITNKEKIDEINKMAIEGMIRFGINVDKDDHIFYHAPCIIVLSSKIGGFSEVNIGCVIENIAIAAQSLGLGSCIIGQTRYLYHKADKIDIDRILKIPENYEHDLAICLGYPKGKIPEAKPRREKVVDYI